MPKQFADTDEFRDARFTRVDFTGAVLRDVDLTNVKISDGFLENADVSGYIGGLTINGVAVAPLVEAELDRLHPERVLMRAKTADGLREGWAAVEAMWQPTIEHARRLPEATRQQRVDDEWSLVETLRHLVFVTDAWFGRAVLGEEQPYHPIGLRPAFLGDGGQLGLDPTAAPSFDDVLAVRTERLAKVREYLATVTDDDLLQPRRNDNDDAWPTANNYTVLNCLHVVTDEEWNHHKYATRDLAALTASR